MGNNSGTLSCTSGEKSSKAQRKEEQYAPTDKQATENGAKSNGGLDNGDAPPAQNGSADTTTAEQGKEESKSPEETPAEDQTVGAEQKTG